MASHRSRSPSTPSEGEIIESGSETKATTSQLPLNGNSVDRPTRASTSSAPRSSSPSVSSRSPRRRRSRTRSRSRSRSPYRDYRGNKRRRNDDDYDDRRFRPDSSRRPAYRSDDRYHDRSQSHRRPRSYYDYDRDDNYGSGLRYNDDYDRRREKRPRTRSRSPYREIRKPKQYSGDEWKSQGAESVASRNNRGKSSTEQLVSGREKSSIVAPDSKPDAETPKDQVQPPSSTAARDRYVFLHLFFHNSVSLFAMFPVQTEPYLRRKNRNLRNRLMRQLRSKRAVSDGKLSGLSTDDRRLLYVCRLSISTAIENYQRRHRARIKLLQTLLHPVR